MLNPRTECALRILWFLEVAPEWSTATLEVLAELAADAGVGVGVNVCRGAVWNSLGGKFFPHAKRFKNALWALERWARKVLSQRDHSIDPEVARRLKEARHAVSLH